MYDSLKTDLETLKEHYDTEKEYPIKDENTTIYYMLKNRKFKK